MDQSYPDLTGTGFYGLDLNEIYICRLFMIKTRLDFSEKVQYGLDFTKTGVKGLNCLELNFMN